jgi:hypothetical protein
MAGLQFEMTYHLRVNGPLAATEGSPVGAHVYWEMSEGWLDGPRLKARIAMPGGDWYRPGVDGFGRPDVRVQFLTDDDAVIGGPSHRKGSDRVPHLSRHLMRTARARRQPLPTPATVADRPASSG